MPNLIGAHVAAVPGPQDRPQRSDSYTGTKAPGSFRRHGQHAHTMPRKPPAAHAIPARTGLDTITPRSAPLRTPRHGTAAGQHTRARLAAPQHPPATPARPGRTPASFVATSRHPGPLTHMAWAWRVRRGVHAGLDRVDQWHPASRVERPRGRQGTSYLPAPNPGARRARRLHSGGGRRTRSSVRRCRGCAVRGAGGALAAGCTWRPPAYRRSSRMFVAGTAACAILLAATRTHTSHRPHVGLGPNRHRLPGGVRSADRGCDRIRRPVDVL